MDAFAVNANEIEDHLAGLEALFHHCVIDIGVVCAKRGQTTMGQYLANSKR